MGLTQDEVVEALGGKNALTSERLIEELTEDVAVAYEDAEARIEANALAHVQLGEDPMRTLERRILLAVVDKRWREHLYEMDYLKEGIGLRAMAQRDPVIEYQREGFDMFAALLEGIKEETIGHLFNVVVQVQQPAAPVQEAEPETTEIPVVRRVPAEDPAESTVVLPNLFRTSPPQNLQYSGPGEDGGVARRGEGGTAAPGTGRTGRHQVPARGNGASPNGDDGVNRAERRRAEKARRRR